MLIDLSRNDIGRIAQVGTVETNEMMIIEKYSHVMHIVGNVRGELRDDLGTMDAFWSCFPAGTLTGAESARQQDNLRTGRGEARYLRRCGWFSGFQGESYHSHNDTDPWSSVTEPSIFRPLEESWPIRSRKANMKETMSKMRAGLTAVGSIEASEGNNC